MFVARDKLCIRLASTPFENLFKYVPVNPSCGQCNFFRILYKPILHLFVYVPISNNVFDIFKIVRFYYILSNSEVITANYFYYMRRNAHTIADPGTYFYKLSQNPMKTRVNTDIAPSLKISRRVIAYYLVAPTTTRSSGREYTAHNGI